MVGCPILFGCGTATGTRPGTAVSAAGATSLPGRRARTRPAGTAPGARCAARTTAPVTGTAAAAGPRPVNRSRKKMR